MESVLIGAATLLAAVVLVASAYWDVERRRIEAQTRANARMEAEFSAKLDKACNEVVRQTQAEIDGMSAEVDAAIDHAYEVSGKKPAGKPLPFQQRMLDRRAELRKRTMRS